MKAIIVGGGVGGLTTALMLHARGIDCEVYEQADAIRTHELLYTNRFGQEIWREPRGLDAGYDVPQFSIHRGRLQGVIYQAARARLGEGRIRTGHRLGAVRE